jgi:hypothetical protein
LLQLPSQNMADYRLNGWLWSVGLAAGGLLLLLFNLGLLGVEQPLVRPLLAGGLALAGLGFFSAFLAARQHWWRLLPAWTLMGLAGMVGLSLVIDPPLTLYGGLLLAALALAFLHIFLLKRAEHWWALLPGGFLLVLALVVAASDRVSLVALGGALFVGLGAVFGLVYLLGERRRQWWALAPAAVLLVFGFAVLTSGVGEKGALVRWWPVLLILAGLLAGWRASRAQPGERLTVNAARSVVGRREAVAPPTPEPTRPSTAVLGEYSQPAPGATVEILPDPDER